MIEYIATKINLRTYAHEEYFVFDIDCGEAFNYRGRVSSSAFFHSMRKKNQNNKNLFYGRQYNGYEQKQVNEHIAHFGPVPITKLKSIWEFYEAVGYDYRKKRWING